MERGGEHILTHLQHQLLDLLTQFEERQNPGLLFSDEALRLEEWFVERGGDVDPLSTFLVGSVHWYRYGCLREDPERARVFAESEKNGPIVEQVTNTILRPTAFSPMK